MINRNKILADIDRQLRGMGTNLNQMAHVANGQGKIPSADKLAQIANEVGKIKSEVDEQWQFLRQSIMCQKKSMSYHKNLILILIIDVIIIRQK